MSVERMYALKPLITIDLPAKSNCMYEMKNIHEIRTSDDEHASKFCNNVANISEQSPLPEVAVLEARQEKILSQLAELKEQVLTLCDVLKFNGAAPTTAPAVKLREPVRLDLIVNANPAAPCWSILALQNVWRDVDFQLRTYRHSEVEGEPPEMAINTKTEFRDTVNVDLIWKEVEDTEIVVPGGHAYPLRGETNLLRYLARHLFPEREGKSRDERTLASIENILDTTHRLRYEDSPKEVQTCLVAIGEKLGRGKWMCDQEEPGIADIAAWSAIKGASLKKIPSSLNSWFERCEKMFLK